MDLAGVGQVDRRVVITALGIAQILAWGTSFYFPAVFAKPIVAETGWSLGFVVAGTSIGLLVAGLVSPQVGQIIDGRGGRPVLIASSIFYATGLVGVGFSPTLPVYLLAWIVIGVGMGTGLYDAVFAALGRMYGTEARGPITNLTLFGGFASTVCWPLSAFMIEHIGWRTACLVYAALHLLLALPLQMAVVGRVPAKGKPQEKSGQDVGARGETSIENEALIFSLLAAVLSIAAGVGSIVVVHLLIFLQARRTRFCSGGRSWCFVWAGSGGCPRRRKAVWESLPPNLDNGRIMFADGRRPFDAVWRGCRIIYRHPGIRCGLWNLVDRTRHAPACAVWAGAISAADGQTRIPQPDRAGLGTVARSDSDRGARLRCDHRRIDRVRAGECAVDRTGVVALPQAD